MKRGHDDFERGLLGELRVRVDRDAAAVVGDREPAAFLELDLDEGRVAGHRLVHGVVDHLGEEVVQSLLVRAADIHAGPPADGLEPLQHLDRRGVVAGLARACRAAGRETFTAALRAAAAAARFDGAPPRPPNRSLSSVIFDLVRDDSGLSCTIADSPVLREQIVNDRSGVQSRARSLETSRAISA